MSNSPFLVRITQIYQYHPDNVQLGAVFINHKADKHRIIILTTQNKLNIDPRVGQQWKILNEQNYSIRRQQLNTSDSVDIWRFMEPTLECVLPNNKAGFVAFLKSEKAFSGIGETSAQLLWDAFRSEVFNIVEREKYAPYERDKSITNFQAIKNVLLKEKSVHGLWAGYRDYANLKHAAQLVEWEIEAPVQRQLFRVTDQVVADYVKQNPYRLFSLGMQFSKVDAIAHTHFGIAPNDERRLSAIVEYGLRNWSEQGNTVANWWDIEPLVRELLKNDHFLVSKAKELDGDILGFLKKDGMYFVSGNFIFEKTIAMRFGKLAKIQLNWNTELDVAFSSAIPEGWQLEKAQEQAVRTALISHIFALTGGAGTGKTTTVKFIVDAYQKLGFVVYPVALSGKAARRLQQSIGIETSTIARLLQKKSIDQPNSVLLVDEASMLDAYTMWRLVTLFHDKSRILLIGDPYQLPPINAGLVLHDVISSKIVNHVELDVIKRQGSDSTIPAYSHAIRNGLLPLSLSNSDVTFQESTNDNVLEAVRAWSLYDSPVIIAATNAMVQQINIKAQGIINPNGKTLELLDMPIGEGHYKFREGDPVVFTLTCHKSNVLNGTLGVIKNAVATDEYACTIELDELDDKGQKRQLKVDWQLFESIDLAYCLTLHKLQGSQAKNVIIYLEKCALLDRSWLYTAVTRAEKQVHIIGKASDFRYGVSRQGAIGRRKTALSEMLKIAVKT